MSDSNTTPGVSTDQAGMKQIADTFGNYQKQLSSIMGTVQDDVNETSSYWSGDTSGVFMQKMDDWQSQAMAIINDLGTLEQKVIDSAQAQKKTDNNNREVINTGFNRMGTPTAAPAGTPGAVPLQAATASVPALPGV